MTKFLNVIGALSLFASAGPALGANYLPPTPLVSVLDAQPRDCSALTPYRMPIITWGADEVTLFANGGVSTASDSLFAKRGLEINLNREDDFSNQVRKYMSCETPFLRATLGMVVQAADVTEADPRTKGVTIYQHSWSAGGDVIVARAGIRQPKDLKGKVIVLQQYGPHLDYILRILSDAGLKPGDVTLRFVKDLTGKGSETPVAAILSDSTVDAVMVISPDAATLTSGGPGSTGSGAEGSLKGAHQILSTRSASHLYQPPYRFTQNDLIAYRLGFGFGENNKVRDLQDFPFEDHDDASVGDLRRQLKINVAQLEAVYRQERMLLNSPESKRLDIGYDDDHSDIVAPEGVDSDWVREKEVARPFREELKPSHKSST